MDGNASPMAAEEPHVADPELPARPNVARVTVTIDPGHAPVWRVADQGGIWDDDDIDAARRVGDQWDVGDGDEDNQDIDGDYDEDIDAGVGADDDAYAYGGFGAVPASGDAVAALPVPETTVGEGEATEEECAVCLEAYEAGDTLRTMPCSHGFHEHCIFGWLAISRLCPLCRFALPAAEF